MMEHSEDRRKVVVLDDDPTGTQLVHGLKMLLNDIPTGLAQFSVSDDPAIYVLTNTRAMTRDESQATLSGLLQDIHTALNDPLIILRGDSTLRGHIALELETLGLERGVGIIVPAYPAGGRVTLDGTHYVQGPSGDVAAAAQTEFAQDSVFGYNHSRLADWAEERGVGGEKHELSRQLLRESDGDALVRLMRSAKDGDVVLPDAETDHDITLIGTAIVRVHAAGRQVIVRCASP